MKINSVYTNSLFQKGGVNISKKIHFTLILALILFVSISAISANEINDNNSNGIVTSDQIELDSDDDTTNINSDLTDNAVNEGNSNDISKEGSVTPTEDIDNGDSKANSPVVDDNTKSDTSNTAVAANNTNNSTQPSKEKSSISISKKSVVRGSNLHIYLKNSNGKGISGKSITVQINGKTYTRTTDKNGAVCFNFSSLLGKYSLKVKFSGDADYLSSQGTFTVDYYRLEPKLTVSKSVARSKNFVGYLKKSNGNGFAGKKIIITFKGKKYTKTTDSKGKFTLKINNPAGKYKMSIKFAGSTSYLPVTKTFTLSVYKQKTNISVASKNVIKGKYLYAYLKTNSGVALVNKPVIIRFNNQKTFYKTTDKNGRVSLKINSDPGSYSTKITYKGNGYYKPTTYSFKTRSFIDKTKITVSSTSVSNGKYLYAYVKNSNNKGVSGEKVVISINGAKYNKTTDKNGRVGLKINCEPNTYTVTINHAASKKYMSSSKTFKLKVVQGAINSAGTGQKITTKTVVINTDVVYNSEKDNQFMNDIATVLKAKGYKVIISTRGPNAHCNDIMGKYSDACILCLFGGCDSGMFYDMSSKWYQNYLKQYNNRVVLGIRPVSSSPVDLATCAWLPRAHDDTYSPANFTGLAYPGTYLNEHNMDYIYGLTATEMANNFLKYAVNGLSIGLNGSLPAGSLASSASTGDSKLLSSASPDAVSSSKSILGAVDTEQIKVGLGSSQNGDSNVNEPSDIVNDGLDSMPLNVSINAGTASTEITESTLVETKI